MTSKTLTAFNEWKPVVVLFMMLCVTLVTTGWGAAWYVSSMVKKFDSGRVSLQQEVEQIKKAVDAIRVDASTDKYTLSAASENALRTAIENPGMRVPDPRNPSDIFVVRAINEPAKN